MLKEDDWRVIWSSRVFDPKYVEIISILCLNCMTLIIEPIVVSHLEQVLKVIGWLSLSILTIDPVAKLILDIIETHKDSWALAFPRPGLMVSVVWILTLVIKSVDPRLRSSIRP